MIPTLSWPPLKNSGFRSMGMSSVAFLFMSDRSAVKGFTFMGIPRRLRRRPGQGQQSRSSDVKETSKYNRFRTNKKRRAFLGVTACSREVAAEARRGENSRAGFESSGRCAQNRPVTMIFMILLLGLGVGVLVGLLGIGGGVVLVPAMVYLLHMDQHLAQGTSLFILLLPIGLGALREYWKLGQVDWHGGILCALGMLFGAFAGSLIALPMPSRSLKGFLGCFLALAGLLLWRKGQLEGRAASGEVEKASG